MLYQHQGGNDHVVAYASRSLKPAEKNYPAHKLEFLALKWAVTEKFHDYLYGTKFEAVTDNNPLTYILTSTKLDATGQRWVAALSSYKFDLTYRRGMQNADADGMSRLPRADSIISETDQNIKQNTDDTRKDSDDKLDSDLLRTRIDSSAVEPDAISTRFPEVLNAVSFSISAEVSNQRLVGCLTSSTIVNDEELIPEEVLNATSLTTRTGSKLKMKTKTSPK